ncbi:MAG: hypothetical protein HWD61_15915 [Parachlamydiaceae bacterium]|nr:MAG: hypothetical protein HWD61_00030 [Parachlamydiaceae bacterium]QLH37439.1 MAG: hypothetical protein HWD61_15915 [Parachlamydiaceae bacterium]
MKSHLNVLEQSKRTNIEENNLHKTHKADVCLNSSACFARFIPPIKLLALETREAFNEKLIKGVRSAYPKMVHKLAVHLQAEK